MIGPAYRYRATVTRWVDGDTFDARVDLGFTVHVDQRFRLAGLDTPERGKPGATEAREFCTAQGAEVTIESVRADKFGRYLARVHFNRKIKTCITSFVLINKNVTASNTFATASFTADEYEFLSSHTAKHSVKSVIKSKINTLFLHIVWMAKPAYETMERNLAILAGV